MILDGIFSAHIANEITYFSNIFKIVEIKLKKYAVNLASYSYFSDAWWFLCKILKFMKIRVDFRVPHSRVFRTTVGASMSENFSAVHNVF